MTLRRWKWRLAGLGFFALFLFVALHLYLNSGYVRAWALSRIEKNLVAQLGEVELGDRFSVDWIGRVKAGPLTVVGEKGPIFSVASVTVRPAYRRLLIGRVEPAAITLDKVDIDLDRAREAFKRLLDNPREDLHVPNQSGNRAVLDISIRANEVQIRTARPGLQKLLRAFDPLSGRFGVRRSATDWRIKGDLRFGKDGHSEFDTERDSAGTLKLKMNLDAPHLDQMVDRYEDLPFSVKDGELLVDLGVDADQNFRRGTTSSTVRMQKLRLEGDRLDSETVGPLDLSGGATVDWDSGQIRLTKTEVGISGYAPLPLEISGRLQLGPEHDIDLQASIHKLDFPRLLRALPARLSPGDEIPAMTGVVSAQFGLKGPALEPERLELTAKLDLTSLRPLQSSAVPLMNSFEYRPARENGHGPIVIVGAKNPIYVALPQIPPVLVAAVVLSEDAGFWNHRGFDFQEIKDSLVEAAEEKRFRGASTITQQLAKNLYFSREKTYARKIREAIATLTLEASLPKSRILEIYLNIIEWGPEIYGVGQAAQHYFGREVGEITPKEAAFLASIIPNPIKYHVYYRQGALSEIWEKRVHELLVKMRDWSILNEEEFTQAEATPIVFAAPKKVEN